MMQKHAWYVFSIITAKRILFDTFKHACFFFRIGELYTSKPFTQLSEKFIENDVMFQGNIILKGCTGPSANLVYFESVNMVNQIPRKNLLKL